MQVEYSIVIVQLLCSVFGYRAINSLSINYVNCINYVIIVANLTVNCL